MLYRYSGLSAQEVMDNRQRYGENIVKQTVHFSIVEKFHQITTFWLIRVLLVVEIIASFVLLILDILINDLSLSFALILLLLAGVIILVYIVTFMVGHWNKSTKHQEVEPLVTTMMIVLALACFVAYYRVAFVRQTGIQPYLGVVVISTAIVGATGVTYLMKRKTLYRQSLKSNTYLSKVIREGETILVPHKEIVVGDIIILTKGDEVPADAELLESNHLIVDESILMDRPRSRKKPIGIETKWNKNTTFPPNQVMKGSIVLRGNGIAEVFAVGDKTALSKIWQ